MRIVLLLGLLHMALNQGRAAEILALLAPLVLAAPLARQIGGAETSHSSAAATPRAVFFVSLGIVLMAGTFAYASVHRFEPHAHGAPVAAVAELKKLNVARVFNDYDFGGYLIANGVAPFIDGRTELYGEKFFVDHNAASGLMEPDNLFRLLDQYQIDATLMRTQSAATKLLVSCRWLAEGLCRRHRHDFRAQPRRGAHRRTRGPPDDEVTHAPRHHGASLPLKRQIARPRSPMRDA